MTLKKWRQLAPILTIVGLTIFIYRVWFGISYELTAKDWWYYPFETLKELNLFSSIGTWNVTSGSPNLSINFALFKFIWSLLANLGLHHLSIVQITFYIPLLFCSSLGSFFLSKKIFKSTLAALTSSIVYSYNSYFLLLQTTHLNIAMAIALTPIFFVLCINFLNTPKNKINLLLAAISFFIMTVYEVRISYVVFIIVSGFFIYNLLTKQSLNKKDIVINSPPLGILTVLLISYWLLPFLSGGLSTSFESVTSRGLFGSNFFYIFDSITLHHPYWTGSFYESFITNPIPLYFWLIPIFALLGLWVGRKNKDVVFFGIVALIGILLSKQVDEPFVSLYPWLFAHVPGFNAFREASKFYFLIALGYSVLIGSFVDWLWKWARQDKQFDNTQKPSKIKKTIKLESTTI